MRDEVYFQEGGNNMKKYIASVRDKETRRIIIIKGEYKNKTDFAIDLRNNGYGIRIIAEEGKFDEACEKAYESYERQKRIKNLIYESDKKLAGKMNMTVKEYREWLKR